MEAARKGAADKALTLSAELLDDLDARNITKVGKQQTGSEKKRGSWQITAEKLKLISDSVPGFDNLTVLAEKLLETGSNLQSPVRQVRNDATKIFYEVQDQIKDELNQICESRESSAGLEKLKNSLALSNTYKTLCDRIKTAENAASLNLLMKDVNVELDVYAQRSKQLKKLLQQRKELIGIADENLDKLIGELKQDDQTKTFTEPDF